jgi:hypothetical protein
MDSTKNLLTILNQKSCQDCTKCCDGWLKANINGIEMYKHKPCYLVESGVGCTSYELRPKDPCKSFKCEWLINPFFPESLKPSLSNVIITREQENGIAYLALTIAGEDASAEVLSWMINYCADENKNLVWLLNTTVGYNGTAEFCNLMKIKFNLSSRNPS